MKFCEVKFKFAVCILGRGGFVVAYKAHPLISKISSGHCAFAQE
jgi:hypothetical protein